MGLKLIYISYRPLVSCDAKENVYPVMRYQIPRHNRRREEVITILSDRIHVLSISHDSHYAERNPMCRYNISA